MNKSTARVWAFFLSLIGVIGVLAGMSCSDTEHAKVIASCKGVKLGATEEEVRKLMGSPINTLPFDDGKRKAKILIFSSSALASTPPQIEIDIATHQVVEIICDEEYRLPPAK